MDKRVVTIDKQDSGRRKADYPVLVKEVFYSIIVGGTSDYQETCSV